MAPAGWGSRVRAPACRVPSPPAGRPMSLRPRHLGLGRGARRAGRPGCATSRGRRTAERRGWAAAGSPERRESTSSRADSGVWLSKNSQLTITTGAKSQAALHSMCCRVTLPSGVVWSLRMPRWSYQRLEYGVAAHHRAQRVGADTDQVVAGGSAAIHRVKARHRRHLGAGQSQLLAAELQTRRRQVGVLGLHQVQQRQQRRTLVGVAADDLFRVDLQPRPHLR